MATSDCLQEWQTLLKTISADNEKDFAEDQMITK